MHFNNIIIPQKYSKADKQLALREKRIRLNLTQKQLADMIRLQKYGDRTIRRWERGESSPSELVFHAIMNIPEMPSFKDNSKKDWTMIDLFAGIGGTRLGFQLTERVKTVFSSEWDKYAAQTYEANFGEQPAGDITKIASEMIPDHDILVGGFPCQAFSQAGLKRGFDDVRGTLFFEVARIVQDKRPRAFLLENVKNLLSHDKGKTFKVIKHTLEDMNYTVYSSTFRARDFGVPQNRERVYIVGFCNNQVTNADMFAMPIPPKTRTCVGEILEHNVSDKFTISDTLWKGHQRRLREHKAKGNGFGYSLFNAKSEYTNTLSARYYKDGSEILIEQKNKNPRKITPREAARLQGFPEEYRIVVSDTQAYKQFGNSVCVPVIKAIAEQILKVLDANGK
ncbi:MAG: DNA (cytosine-5-)-methyltransferase [Bifidobacteriaceae bacterium]|jgi:DNA (cytosine-5)-methyltransferase 1|nr:DNA (cytosine-5-)-methyltransferase [Bifidobacteriaceae bacterium]